MLRIGLRGVAMAAVLFATAAVSSGQEEDRRIKQPVPRPEIPKPSEGDQQPCIEIEPLEFNFGEVWEGEEVRGEIVVKNTGTAPLSTVVRTTCGCTVATRPKTPLMPGEADKFLVTYNTSHKGRANKKVILTTNDPEKPKVYIPVRGLVKPLFEMEPSPNIMFNAIEPETEAEQVVRMVCQYPQPVSLKLLNADELKHFSAELKEVERGKAFELKVKTKPPIPEGRLFERLKVATGLKEAKEITLRISAHIPERVEVVPSRLVVTSQMNRPTKPTIRVRYRTSDPVKITRVTSTSSAIKFEQLPAREAKEDATVGMYLIRVFLPSFDEMPESGAKLIIETDAEESAFKRFEVPITRHVRPSQRVERKADVRDVRVKRKDKEGD